MKIPRWPFDKFINAKRILGTQMKATGEVMGIAPTFEAALMKSIRCLEQNTYSLIDDTLTDLSDAELDETPSCGRRPPSVGCSRSAAPRHDKRKNPRNHEN